MNHLRFLIFFLFVGFLFAQGPDLHFDRIGIEEGLSQSTVYCILKDKDGFMWFATQDGLDRYDGHNFYVYQISEKNDSSAISDNWVNWLDTDANGNIWIATNNGGLNKFDPIRERFTHYRFSADDPNSITSDATTVCFVDSSQHVWIGTDKGLNRLDPESGKIIRFVHDPENPRSLSNNRVKTIIESPQGKILVGTDQGGLNYIDPQTLQIEKNSDTEEKLSALKEVSIASLFADSLNNLWIGTTDGLYHYSEKGNRLTTYFHDENNSNSLSNNYVRSIHADKTGMLWLATYGGGLDLFDPYKKRFYNFTNDIYDPVSLVDDYCWGLYIDRDGIAWVGTNKGISKAKQERFRNYTYKPSKKDRLNNSYIWGITEDHLGYIWLATNGGGLNRFDPHREKFTYFRHDPDNPASLSDDKVLSVAEDKQGNLWIGTVDAGLDKLDPEKNSFSHYTYDRDNPDGISNNKVFVLYVDNRDVLWIGTDNGLNRFEANSGKFVHYLFDANNPKSISNNHIRNIYEDSKGNLWIGTYGGGLNKINRKSGQFTRYENNPDDPQSISSNRVRSMYEDSTGTLWVGTANGINKFDAERETFKAYTVKHGLPNNMIYGILPDDNGHIWLSTNKGLSRFDPRTLEFKNYDVSDGLQSYEFNGGSWCRAHTGELYFGGVNGFNRFNPEEVVDNPHEPPIKITSIKVFGKEIDLDKAIPAVKKFSLSYKQNYIRFEFAALDFENPLKNQYTYLLEGFDDNWHESGNVNEAIYTNLPSGQYTFWVRGSNNDGVWNTKGVHVDITITPPFWGTWWFRTLIVFLVIVLTYSFHYARMAIVNRQKEQLKKQVDERTGELKESYSQLAEAKKETDNILDNVEEGLFLLNPDFIIKNQYSRSLESLFETENLGDRNFLDLLNSKIPDQVAGSIKEYLELMFSDEIDEGLLNELNPLSEIEANFKDDQGVWLKSKYLQFKIGRVRKEDGQIEELIVSVSDISNQKRLSQELEETENKQKKQMEWLLSILHVETPMLVEFMTSVKQEINYVDQLLRSNKPGVDFNHLLEEIFRSIHLIKGNAGLLDLKFFTERTHEFEEQINNVRQKEMINGSDFIPLVIRLGDLKNMINELDGLIGRISNIQSHFRPKRSYENDLLMRSLANLVTNLSGDYNKDIRLVHDNFNPSLVPYKYRLTIKEVLIQMIRNAVVHGIEDEDTRSSFGKSKHGHIEIGIEENDDFVIISFRDDGRGPDLERLKISAIEKGYLTKQKCSGLKREEIAELMFASGLTTVKKADLNAGRGFGLDALKKRVEKSGGKIEIEFEENEYCLFKIFFPLAGINQEQLENVDSFVIEN